jgi:hypothetical protein
MTGKRKLRAGGASGHTDPVDRGGKACLREKKTGNSDKTYAAQEST